MAASKNAHIRWQMGLILVIVALGLLGALLQQMQPPPPKDAAELESGELEVEVQLGGAGPRSPDDYLRKHFNGIKWAFYVFVWLTVLYMYGFTSAAFKKAAQC